MGRAEVHTSQAVARGSSLRKVQLGQAHAMLCEKRFFFVGRASVFAGCVDLEGGLLASATEKNGFRHWAFLECVLRADLIHEDGRGLQQWNTEAKRIFLGCVVGEV